MFPSIKLLLELHFNQILVVVCGCLLAKQLFPTRPLRATSPKETEDRNLDAATVYPIGFLWFAVVGAISLISPVPTRTIVGLTAALIAVLTLRSRPSLSEGLDLYRRLCLCPFLIFLVPAIFFLAHFTATEIAQGIDPWLLIERTQSYKVPDHYLQWWVSDNFFKGLPIETNFNPKGKSMWSAGDRPILMGLLDATLSQITNARSITMYYLRVIFISTLVIPVFNSILREELKVKSAAVRFLTLSTIAISPFFLINTIFTWPKMAGLSFGMMGLFLFTKAVRCNNARYAFVGGIALALGLISHTAAMFCLLATLLYTGSNWLISNRASISLRRLGVLTATLMVPLILITQVHGRLLARVTNQTNLLARVQLCVGGSYAHLTPVETVFQSCKKYYERKGISGILEDRRESLRRAFEFTPIAYTASTWNALTTPGNIGNYLRSLNTPFLLTVPMSIGHLTPVFSGLLLIAYMASITFCRVLPFTSTSLLLPIGLLLLVGFSCMLGAYSEMSSHVVPFVIPVFIQLGILLELHRLWSPGFYLYCMTSISLSLAVFVARLNLI